MSIRRMDTPIQDILPIEYVLVSVSDKTGLDELVPGLLKANPTTMFVSTGGSGIKIKELIGENPENNYISVENLTKTPEMEGGLIKTLTSGIHSRLLGERENPKHKEYLKDNTPVNALNIGFFDLVVLNFYPFEEVAAEFPDKANFEDVRGNIDIGGPTMLRAAAKNFLNCAVLVKPEQYSSCLESLNENKGISLENRFIMAKKAFEEMEKYDKAIADFFKKADNKKDIKSCYFVGGK